MTTMIKCTKSQFRAALEAEFAPIAGRREHPSDDDTREVIAGLARAADAHRGTFTGHSAYLDLDFVVSPDGAPDFTQTGWVIPAVTDAQRTQARGAARATVLAVQRGIAAALADSDWMTAHELDKLAAHLTAAAGHLRIASGETARELDAKNETLLTNLYLAGKIR